MYTNDYADGEALLPNPVMDVIEREVITFVSLSANVVDVEILDKGDEMASTRRTAGRCNPVAPVSLLVCTPVYSSAAVIAVVRGGSATSITPVTLDWSAPR